MKIAISGRLRFCVPSEHWSEVDCKCLLFQMAGGEPKGPCSSLTSREVKQHLEEKLLTPLLRDQKNVCAFRMVWRVNDKHAQEDIWHQMPQFHTQVNDFVKELDICSFFISTVTATSSTFSNRPDKPTIVYPALAFWIVLKDGDFADMQRTVLMKMHANPYNARVKLLASGTNDGTLRKALHIVMKDSAGKFVERKALVDYSHVEEGQKPALTRIMCTDEDYKAMLMELQIQLAICGVTATIQHY